MTGQIDLQPNKTSQIDAAKTVRRFPNCRPRPLPCAEAGLTNHLNLAVKSSLSMVGPHFYSFFTAQLKLMQNLTYQVSICNVNKLNGSIGYKYSI